MPCSKTSFLKLPSIHRFRCLVLGEIFTHVFMTKNLQSQWRAKFMNFWPTQFRSRFALCSLWSVIFLCLLCVYCTLLAPPPHPPKSCIDYFSQIFLGGLYIPKMITLCKICGVNRVYYGGFENSQWEGGACASVGFFWPPTDESSGVENTSYVRASERPHSD